MLIQNRALVHLDHLINAGLFYTLLSLSGFLAENSSTCSEPGSITPVLFWLWQAANGKSRKTRTTELIRFLLFLMNKCRFSAAITVWDQKSAGMPVNPSNKLQRICLKEDVLAVYLSGAIFAGMTMTCGRWILLPGKTPFSGRENWIHFEGLPIHAGKEVFFAGGKKSRSQETVLARQMELKNKGFSLTRCTGTCMLLLTGTCYIDETSQNLWRK